MQEPIRYESIHEPLDEEERLLMDPDTWDWKSAEEGVTVREPSVSIRFTREEYVTLWRNAQAQGLTTREFIKRVALAAISTPTP
jgi:hypothetical protein